ncbi:hypothetical protein SEVIR_8G196766v4 [Setaria viridis]|uniref:Uncharacterized protein n=1 Tax=Setaria viridis TaxID=4556 RepID=A0A4U6TH81_SETVI|nr:hypothetical protein SEVIR_8G196766v2 [Setaria viridis]
MERNQKEKSEEPWVGRRILGVAFAGVVAVAAGAFVMLSRNGDGAEQEQTAGRTMKGPDTSGERISRDKFEEDPKTYFKTCRQKGPKAAVDDFK